MAPRSRRTWMVSAALAFGLIAISSGSLLAQVGGVIRGTVTDGATGEALSNVRLTVVGTMQEARTATDGTFEFRDVPLGRQVVRATLIGYSRVTAEVSVELGRAVELTLTMIRAPIQLDELVVTGTAGRTERREIGNAISTLNVADLADLAPVANIQELLQARSPGLTMYRNSGLSGAASNVTIRGAGSLNAGYQPVYYIDGIRFRGQQVATGGTTNGTVQYSSPLNFIDPSDIERIEVIKGPAAATLYGADAAGGVIQIITKRGTRGAAGVQWTASVEYSQQDWYVDNPTNFYQCNPSRIRNPGTYPGCADPSSVEWIDHDSVVHVGIPEEDIMRDPAWTAVWGDSMFVLTDDPLHRHPNALRTGIGTDAKLSARGGGQLFNYYLSFNSMNEEGIVPNNYQNRQGGRANFEFTPAGNLNMVANFGYTRMHYRLPLSDNASNGLLRNAFRGRARARNDRWESGYHGFGPDESNEFNRQTFEERTVISLTTSFDPWPWFENRIVMGMDNYVRRDQTFYEIDPTLKWGATSGTGSITQRMPNWHTWTVDYSGSLRARLSDNLTSRLSGGMQLNAAQYRRYTASGNGLVANNLNLVSAAANTSAGEGFSEQTSLGFFAQEQIGWRDRLFVTAAVRVDDNSAFGSDFSMVVYPKASLSWVISDESFFNFPMFDDLKLRAAWGQAGNAPAPFSADRTYSPETATYQDQAVNALTPAAYGNRDLRAETGSEIEVGFDASLFQGALGLEATYFNQHTIDALMRIPAPPSSGFTGNYLTNIGEIMNSGFEVLATLSPVRQRSFAWDMTVAFISQRNELVSFGGTRDEIQFGEFTNSQRHREGYPLGAFWAVDVERNADGTPVTTASSGGTGVTLITTCTWPDDVDPEGYGGSCQERYIGPALPPLEVGFSNTFTLFGGLRLFANLDYKAGHYTVCAICSIRNRSNTNTWEVAEPAMTFADSVEQNVWRARQTETHIMPADFVKLREVSLSYTIPQSLGGPFRASRWTVTLSGRNLWLWTEYDGGGDPEVQFYSSPSTFNRSDYAAFPQPRRLAASIQVSF